MLAISVTRLAAAALAVPIIAAPPKLATAALRRSACKVARGRAASNAS